MFSTKPKHPLEPFIDLEGIDDDELAVMDIKRAETEEVSRPENYPEFRKNGRDGVLLIHGFTGAPYEMRPLADHLYNDGYTVYLARVAGHGSRPEYLETMSYLDWYESLKYGYYLLRNNCERIFVAGQSMGGLLAVNLAVNHEVEGLILSAPCFRVKNRLIGIVPFAKHIKRFETKEIKEEDREFFYDRYSLEGLHQLMMLMRLTEGCAPRVHVPTLTFQCSLDKTVEPCASEQFHKDLGTYDKRLIIYDDGETSVHALTTESNPWRPEMFAEISGWLKRF
ncbi:alpha/beta hydrolase [Limisalsivibrio acetivorans]|uniref:alpha/beta hydrolase n=1 Tax=Limisalsivibrio acetivorans TaxID=1304888 RepID=UPI00040AD7DB|nr:alpha/beta fold hydrolase [Limisalsivibrio acetivorans]